mmetsp:Transcript_56298/g.163267  ORF Transcript_56298/g.163267 Transcript_56298/m.163267 type:complete len:204 (-) Transcript_56298:933-1544(-)
MAAAAASKAMASTPTSHDSQWPRHSNTPSAVGSSMSPNASSLAAAAACKMRSRRVTSPGPELAGGGKLRAKSKRSPMIAENRSKRCTKTSAASAGSARDRGDSLEASVAKASSNSPAPSCRPERSQGVGSLCEPPVAAPRRRCNNFAASTTRHAAESRIGLSLMRMSFTASANNCKRSGPPSDAAMLALETPTGVAPKSAMAS